MSSAPLILAVLLLLPGAARGEESPQDMLARAKALDKAAHHDDAAALARTAAEKGSGQAWYWLGMNSTGDTKSYFVKAAELGYPKAFGYALDAVLFRAGAQADVVEAKKLADLAREKGIKLGFDSKGLLLTVDRCFEAGEPSVPTGLRKEELEEYTKPGADCAVFETGVGAMRDYERYLHCLLAQSPADRNALAEVFANGWGVPRNPRNALAFVCHGGEVPAELEGMVDALYKTKDEPALKEEFRFCDYVTSGQNGGVCAVRQERVAARRREEGFAKVAAACTPEQRASLAILRAAGEAFFAEHARSEMDMSGSARAAIAIAEEARQRDRFLTDLRIFERGRFPAVREVKATDLDLIAAFGRLMRDERIPGQGTVTRSGVSAAQDKWTAYRDAWLAFAAARYPSVPADVWKTWATSRRVKQLRKLLPPESESDSQE